MLRLKERKYVKPEVKSDKIDQSKGVFVGTKKKVMRLDLPNTKKSIFVKTLILESRLKAILELAEKGVNVELPLVDPNNETAISDAITQVLTDDGLREELMTTGEQRAKEFTWQRCALETLAVYELIK